MLNVVNFWPSHAQNSSGVLSTREVKNRDYFESVKMNLCVSGDSGKDQSNLALFRRTSDWPVIYSTILVLGLGLTEMQMIEAREGHLKRIESGVIVLLAR